MKYVLVSIIAAVIGSIATLSIILIQDQKVDKFVEVYPKSFSLYEEASAEGFAPQLVGHELELLSPKRFYYRADGHMTMERVLGAIRINNEGVYEFVVDENLTSSSYTPGDILFKADSILGNQISIEKVEINTLLPDSNSFILE